ncbi:MAG: tetratricopeptide repeat protein [Deltaproteobacteria bacterium]|nr:MAG: tetratricopeptide repeat protein [Deltaproteobacteria bacterium]
MNEERARRKLSGILSADAAGYSRLMERDETSTIRHLEDSKALMSKLIQQFKGKVVDAVGDNLLAEFNSVVNATECAVKIQEELNTRNAELSEDKRLEFRIGINLGDVIEDGGTIYGDGVIIAARLEKLAKAGGICISGTVYEQVKNKLSLEYEYLGEKSVKNISEPIRAHHILMRPSGVAPKKNNELKLPDKPSIAVLPFVNMSGDSEQEYFSDGITEEIITGLSKIHGMFVIARNSTFTYKNKPTKVQQVSKDLGVRYVLEGSVRKAKNQVRITAQLVDAVDGHHLGAERYDHELKDIFALQDEITMKILTALQVELTAGEKARIYGKGTDNFEAYMKCLQAYKYYNRLKDGFPMARKLANEAIELDENFPAPYILLGWIHWVEARLQWTESLTDSIREAYSISQKALALDDSIPDIHALLGVIHLYQMQHEEAINYGERAVVLGPNHSDVHALMAHIYRFSGEFEEALVMIKKALRLQPNLSVNHVWCLMEISMCHYCLGRYEEAISFAKQYRNVAEELRVKEAIWVYYLMLTLNYIKMGLDQGARDALAELLRLFPEFSLEWNRIYSVYRDPKYLEAQQKDLKKAGLK